MRVGVSVCVCVCVLTMYAYMIVFACMHMCVDARDGQQLRVGDRLAVRGSSARVARGLRLTTQSETRIMGSAVSTGAAVPILAPVQGRLGGEGYDASQPGRADLLQPRADVRLRRRVPPAQRPVHLVARPRGRAGRRRGRVSLRGAKALRGGAAGEGLLVGARPAAALLAGLRQPVRGALDGDGRRHRVPRKPTRAEGLRPARDQGCAAVWSASRGSPSP